MKIGAKIISLIVAISIIFTGCMSTNNLNDLTVVQALGVDDIDGKTNVTLQYLNTNKSGNATQVLNGNITAVSSGVSSNISDALYDAAKSLSQKIFLGQNKLIIFGSEYSQLGIDKGLDYLIRSIDSRPDVLVAMSTSTAKDIVENEQNGGRIPAENIYKLLNLGEENGLGAVVCVNDLLNIYADLTTDVYLPILQSNDDGVSCEGLAVFADEKAKIVLDEYETFGFLFLKDKIKGGNLIIENEEFGFIGVDLIKSKCKPRVVIENDNIVFKCDLQVNILLNELEKGATSSLTPNKIRDIEELTKLRIEDMCNKGFYKCVKNKSDPFAIGKFLAKENVKKYNELKDDWHNVLPNIVLDINIQVKLKNINDNSLKK